MRLPKSVQQIADIIGQDQALHLVRTLREQQSGKTLSVYVPAPKSLHINHMLVTLLGWDDAMALCEALGGTHVYPSRCRYLERAMANRPVLALRDTGMSIAEIAAELGMSEKWVDAIVDARDMVRRGISIDVVAHSVKINPLTLGYILDVEVNGDVEPVKRRSPPRQSSPQYDLSL